MQLLSSPKVKWGRRGRMQARTILIILAVLQVKS